MRRANQFMALALNSLPFTARRENHHKSWYSVSFRLAGFHRADPVRGRGISLAQSGEARRADSVLYPIDTRGFRTKRMAASSGRARAHLKVAGTVSKPVFPTIEQFVLASSREGSISTGDEGVAERLPAKCLRSVRHG